MELSIKKPPWVNVFPFMDKCNSNGLINDTSFNKESDFLRQTTPYMAEFLMQKLF
jgi:hypothetical protein